MTDNELLNLINVIQTSKAEFQTVEVKEQKKVLRINCMTLCPHFQTRTAEALSCSVYMKTRASE